MAVSLSFQLTLLFSLTNTKEYSTSCEEKPKYCTIEIKHENDFWTLKISSNNENWQILIPPDGWTTYENETLTATNPWARDLELRTILIPN